MLAAGNTAVCYWSTGSCWNEMGDTRWSQHPTTATRRHRNDTKTVLPCCSFVSRPQLISIQDKFISWSSPERKKNEIITKISSPHSTPIETTLRKPLLAWNYKSPSNFWIFLNASYMGIEDGSEAVKWLLYGSWSIQQDLATVMQSKHGRGPRM